MTVPRILSWMKNNERSEERGLRVFHALWQRGISDFYDIPLLSKRTMKTLHESFYIPFLELYRKGCLR